MQQNIKEFVQKIIGEEYKGNFPNLYIVGNSDQQTGPYRTIQEAIDAADPYSLIKVTEGFYEESLIITYTHSYHIPKELTLPKTSQPQKSNSQNKLGVVLLVESGIGIHIKLPKNTDEVKINGLKISHSGSSAELQMQLLQHQHIISIFDHKKNLIQELQHEFVNRVAFNKIENMILYLQKGVLTAESCVFSLRYLLKSCRTVIPAICIDTHGCLYLYNSEVKGNQVKQTIGIINKLGTIHIKNSIISDHQQGGILAWGTAGNNSKLIKNRIQRNSIGLSCVGENFAMKIYLNQIIDNDLGIKIGLGCCAQVNRNYICENINGIQVNSAFPIIYLNKIQKHKQNGIILKSYKKMLCLAKIKKNVSIVGNMQNGIVVEGSNNRSKIVDNYLIGFNKQSGIKVAKSAFPLIYNNKIHKNFKQGILITQNTNAVVEKNKITGNIECNISLGGVNSHQTLITENSIKESLGAGIVIVEGCPQILRNDITNNFQGIISIESYGNIRRNYISQNKNNGLILKNNTLPSIVENFIMRNNSIGLFITDESLHRLQNEIKIFSNIIVSNQINVGMDIRNEIVAKGLKSSNTIDGQITMPDAVKCTIM